MKSDLLDWFVGLLLAALLGYGLFQYGRHDGAQELLAQIASDDKIAKDAQVKLNKLAEQREAALKAQVQTLTTNESILKAKHEDAIEKAIARARAGTSGLRCPASPAPGNQAPSNPTTAGFGVEEGGTDLVPEASEDVLRAAADSARLVRERNLLIDLYNAARDTCNAPAQ